jgi:hypothetical protein
MLLFNRALIEKWLWRYVHERDAWWILNLVVRGVGGVLMNLLGRRVGLWRNIRRGWGKFSNHTRFEVGDGSKVSF